MMKGGGRARLDWMAVLLARWKRLALALVLVWVLVSYLIISPLRCPESGEGSQAAAAAGIQERLRAVSAQLDQLRAHHHALIAHIKQAKLSGETLELSGPLWESAVASAGAGGPSVEYEVVRRRIAEHTQELGYYAAAALTKAIANGDLAATVETIVANLQHRTNVLLTEQQRLSETDGHAAWREKEAAATAALVQTRLRHLQNPADCTAARKILCNLNKGCGFGCQLHHLTYCLIFAYATQRTLVVNSRGWRYNAKGWEQVFYPLSDTCTALPADDAAKAVQWPGMELESAPWSAQSQEQLAAADEHMRRAFVQGQQLAMANDAKVVSLPFIDSITQKPKFLPLAIPKDLADRILKFNGDPASWWVGQMLRYILRPRPHTQAAINDTIARLNYRNPIVGVHVRRTDKVGTEAAFHHLHEYMKYVEAYWRRADLAAGAEGATPRRVYLATDDPHVLRDARKQYPEVEFVGDPDIARGAATHRRYTPTALQGLLTDLTLLARADHLVCTFSSQVGRVAYELMQGNRADASDAVNSLDDIYYFGGQNAHDRRAAYNHDAASPDEISFQAGDMIGIAGNHWNGYGRGTNRRTNQNGLIPWYKTVEHLVLYPFPEYDHVTSANRTAPPASSHAAHPAPQHS